MPGAAGAGGGGPLAWSETTADPNLIMTYPEFLAKKRLPAALIPPGLLNDDKGQPLKRTAAGWWQVHQLYMGASKGGELKPVAPGRTGIDLLGRVQKQLAVIKKENEAVRKAYGLAKGGFSFEIGYPQFSAASVTAEGADVTVEVVMRVNKSLQTSYGAKLYRLLKPYDNFGTERQPFTFVTYQGGYFHPQTFTMHPSSIAMWADLWSQCQVELTLKDRNGNPVAVATPVPAGFGPNAPTLIAYPPELRRVPNFGYLMPEQDRDFSGTRRLGVDYTRGWWYQFTFHLSREDMAKLHSASAKLVMAEVAPAAAGTAQTRPFATGAGTFGPGSSAAEGGAPRAGTPPPSIRQMAPIGAGAGYSVPMSPIG
ncbi:MAG TPA: hypothetical protein VGM19_14265 [Armatimonadota bacterium]|jgi:hypothetical protein